MLVVDDPDGAAGLVDAAVARAHPSAPVVVLMAKTTELDLAFEILTALGKRTELSGHPSLADIAWRNVRIWIEVLPIERLTIANSDFLEPAALAWLERLRGVLLLIHDPNGATVDLNAAVQRFDRADPSYVTNQPPHHPSGPVRPPAPFPACPTDAFPFFLRTCRQLLAPEHYQTVFRAYRTVQYKASLRQPDINELEPHESAAQIIRELLEPIADPHHRLTLARGIENAFFEGGWLLRIDPAQFMQAKPTMPLAAMVARVNWYSDAELAATAALAILGLDAATLSSLNADLIYLTSAGLPTVRRDFQLESLFTIPQELHSALKAFWHDRHAAPAVPATGPLFPRRDGSRQAAKTIKTRLSRIALETGLPIAAHWTPPADQRATRWMRQHGITLAKL